MARTNRKTRARQGAAAAVDSGQAPRAGFGPLAAAELAREAGDFRQPVLVAPPPGSIGLPPGQDALGDRERLVVDAAGALAWPGAGKQALLLRDPYRELAELPPEAGAPPELYERLHMSLGMACRVLAGSTEARDALVLRHGRACELVELPALRWPAGARAVQPHVLVHCPWPALGGLARSLADELSALVHDAPTTLLPAGQALLPLLRDAMAGEGDGLLAAAALHVHVGPGALDCTRLRLHESWINGVPVVQLLAAPASPEPRTVVEHGVSGLLVTERAAVADSVAWLLGSPDYAQQLAQRARIHVLRHTPSWDALRGRLAA